jgi:hypothetical protein
VRKFDHNTGAFVPVIRNRVVTPDGMVGGNLFEDETGSVILDDAGEVLVLSGGAGHVNTHIIHDCRGPRGGTMTIKPPEFVLVVTNPEAGATVIDDLFEDETGAVIVDDLLESLTLNKP